MSLVDDGRARVRCRPQVIGEAPGLIALSIKTAYVAVLAKVRAQRVVFMLWSVWASERP